MFSFIMIVILSIFQIVLMQREYFKQGKIEQFRQILLEGSSHGMLSFVQHMLTIPFPMRSIIYYF